MIVDTHTHLGDDRLVDSHRAESELIEVSSRAGIDALIVQPAQSPTIEITRRLHDRLIQFVSANPRRIYGMASVNPHYDLDVYFAELRRCIRDHGFVGVKVNPVTHAWNPMTHRGVIPFMAAETFDVPLMIHIGDGSVFTHPSNLYYRAKSFPHVRVVLAHAGNPHYAADALLLAKECSNVYLETSRGATMGILNRFVKELGPRRVMFGSDSPDEMEGSLWMYRHSKLSSAELEWCLGRTACEVYRLDERPRNQDRVSGSTRESTQSRDSSQSNDEQRT